MSLSLNSRCIYGSFSFIKRFPERRAAPIQIALALPTTFVVGPTPPLHEQISGLGRSPVDRKRPLGENALRHDGEPAAAVARRTRQSSQLNSVAAPPGRVLVLVVVRVAVGELEADAVVPYSFLVVPQFALGQALYALPLDP